MSKVVMSWHGGSSYAVPAPGDGEAFSSLKAAKAEFLRRTHDRYFPCVDRVPVDDGGPSAWIFFGEEGDYPDRVLSFGPRGGLKCEPA